MMTHTKEDRRLDRVCVRLVGMYEGGGILAFEKLKSVYRR